MGIRTLLRHIDSNAFIRRVLVVLFVIALFLVGIQLRRWIGQSTRHVRYQHDIVNAFYWGSETMKEARRLSPNEASANSFTGFLRGYLALYDRVKREAYNKEYGLDYAPLRLLVMSIWAREVRNQFPGVDDGHPKLVNPLLKINVVCEFLSALAIFLLVRFCLKRQSARASPSLPSGLPAERRAFICGLAAASVAWLEPSMILDAHGWPQWDAWLLPFYLFAAFAAVKNRWFLCGFLLAVGAMFKGQILFVTPFFVLWPLWQKRWNRALRVLAGFLSAAALITSPWVLRPPVAWVAVLSITGACSFLVLQLRWRYRAAWVSGITACAAFAIGAMTNGSFAWLQVGFLYGSEHYPYLVISSCYNLPSLLSNFGWSLKDPFWSVHFGSFNLDVTLQWTLRLTYLGALVICAYGAARQMRDRDPRTLIAITAPWLLMFALLGQMHERYLMWGAVVSAVALGVSLRLSIIHFIISAASTAMIVHVMLIDKKLETTLWAIDLLKNIRSYASVLVLGCVAVYLWNTLPTPILQRRAARLHKARSLSLGPEPEEA
ncbi:MAG TPA: hypothetical protein VFA51_10510 [Candidatus Udaeobacter sp.]|nr:hypothetical protein [Candidatus Udaeobacter sp.]